MNDKFHALMSPDAHRIGSRMTPRADLNVVTTGTVPLPAYIEPERPSHIHEYDYIERDIVDIT